MTIELRRIQGELEKTRDKYSHLYDFAPGFMRGPKNDQVADSLVRIEQRLEKLETPVATESGSRPAPGA